MCWFFFSLFGILKYVFQNKTRYLRDMTIDFISPTINTAHPNSANLFFTVSCSVKDVCALETFLNAPTHAVCMWHTDHCVLDKVLCVWPHHRVSDEEGRKRPTLLEPSVDFYDFCVVSQPIRWQYLLISLCSGSSAAEASLWTPWASVTRSHTQSLLVTVAALPTIPQRAPKPQGL